jgi:calcineurin-like phosphoesterase family protein
MTIWFSADLHVSHQAVIGYCNRPYSSVEEMNEALVENFNALVKPEDTLYILGDFAMKKSAVVEFGPRFNGYKVLIHGNHDASHPRHRNGERMKRLYYDNGFAEIHDQLTIDLGGRPVVLSHFPYDNQDPRFTPYIPPNRGEWLLSGHVHERWMLRHKNLNVGIDVHGMKPISAEQVMEIIKNESR